MSVPVDLAADVATITSEAIALRRALHVDPELAFEEVRTAQGPGADLARARRRRRAADGGCTTAVDYALPALVNDDHVTGAVERAAARVIGRPNVLTRWRYPFSDDFALCMAAAPGV